MSTNMILVIVCCSVVVHGFGIGLTWALYSDAVRSLATGDWSRAGSPWPYCGAFLWPITLPAIVAIRIVRHLQARTTVPQAVARERNQR